MSESSVFLFVPNIIGYVRILLALLSFYYMPFDYVRAFCYYLLSQLLDALDGHAARYLNQSSRFGAMLDQLTDRCSTLCLLMVLGNFYPSQMILFQISAAIDIASHWLHLHSSDIKGSKHYKQIEDSNNPLKQVLKFYYTSRPFLFFMCAGNELFYCLLYIQHFTPGFIIPVFRVGIWKVLCYLCFPISFVKSAISVFHLVTAAQSIVEIDTSDRSKPKSG